MTEPALGFIGLGAMGRPMSTRLVEHGYSVAAYDVAPAAIAALERAGATAASSPAEAAARADIVLVSLPNSALIEQVVFGDDGLLGAMRPGSTLVDLSSARPSSTRRIAAALAERGVDCLDAPVSRGAPSAANGTLSIMVGGSDAVVARCRPVLEVLGTDILHVGATTSGHTLKCLNNAVAAANLVAANEVLLVAARLGLDPKRVTEVINASSGRTNQFRDRIPQYVLTETYRSSFSLALMYKDVRIAMELADESGVPVFATDLARQLYALAAAGQWAGEDNQAISQCLQDLLGQPLFAEPAVSA
jgi:3-hydroxyisobutyrate dehydrogenase